MLRLIAVGRLRDGPEAALFARYNARLRPRFTVTEIPEARGSATEVKRREGEALRGALPADVLARRDKRDFSALHHRALLAPHNLERVRTLLAERRAEVGAYVDLARVHRDLLDRPPPVGAPGWRPWAVHVWNVVTAELWLRTV